jgi:outer membrane protein assembly factor BamB
MALSNQSRRVRPAFVLGAWVLPFVLAVSSFPADEAQTNGPAPVQLVGSEGEGNQYWPRWRGPSGQGLVSGSGYPDTWSDTENVLWKVNLPGQGNSSPIIWKDRIFLTTAHDRGKRRSILCLDRADGKLLWESAAPEATPEEAKDKNGYASGTPVTDGERVYAYFGNHGLWCVDFEGKRVWHQSFGPLDAYHGTSCSPLLYKDRVIIFQDHRGASGSFVAAFAKRTGKELWKVARKEKVGWGSPVAVRVGDHDEIIVSSENRVYAYEPESGKVLWTCAGNLVEVTPTPVVGHGLIYCCSGRVGPTLAIKPGGVGDVTKTHLAWEINTGSPFIPSPLLSGDYLYMVNDILSVARCYEARTGKLMWAERLGTAVKHGFSASPVSVDGKVFLTNDSGDTFVLAAGPTFKLLHTNPLNATTLASPALLDGKWYFRTDKQLLCIGKKQG